MGFLSGLEKFGLGKITKDNLFDDDDKTQEVLEKKKEAEKEAAAKKKTEYKETDFLLFKTVHCPVCDETFRTRTVKTGKARRLQPDFDLRPRFSNIDTNKYDVSSCQNCGYTAMHRYFPHLTKGQITLIKEEVCSKFQAPESVSEEQLDAYTYEQSIDLYKLALYNTVVKKGKTSEKAYACLKISWLYRGWLEELEQQGITDGDVVENCKKEEAEYYEEAYEGLVKAVASESFPMCGMEESTMNLLLANMAYKLGKIDVASKLVSSILVAPAASHQAKDRAMDLKEEILKTIHSEKEVAE